MTNIYGATGNYPAQHKQDQRIELALTPNDAENTGAADTGDMSMFGADGFTFADLVDIVNPLQHLPIVSTLYRNETGDDLAPAPRVMGATLFFGPIGLVGALANIAVESTTGKDIGENVASWVGISAEEPATPSDDTPAMVAENFDSNDPISAWARSEIAWAQQEPGLKSGLIAPEPEASDIEKTRNDIVPDAAPFLAQQERWAAAPSRNTNIAYLTDDIRAASRAYEATLGAVSAQNRIQSFDASAPS